MAPPRDRDPWDKPLDHLRVEMERIDLLVRIQVLRARRVAGDDAFRGLAISDDDIDAVFLRPLGAPHWTAAADSDELAHLWPRDVPRARDLDLDFMAKRFELSGGHIRERP